MFFAFSGRKGKKELPGPGVFLASAVKISACQPHIDGCKYINNNYSAKNDEKPVH